MIRLECTSSHQSNVDVTGSQYPSFAGGYGTEGSQEGILSMGENSRRGNIQGLRKLPEPGTEHS